MGRLANCLSKALLGGCCHRTAAGSLTNGVKRFRARLRLLRDYSGVTSCLYVRVSTDRLGKGHTMSVLSDTRARRLRLAAGLAVLVGALIVPATASAAAKWLDYPTCTATSSTLTCTGKAAGISRPNTNPFFPGSKSPVQASITTQVLYTCDGVVGVNATLYAAVSIHNGEKFTLSITPDPFPNTGVHDWCDSPEITWIPIFYNVSVDIGWEIGEPFSGLDAPQRLLVLTGPVGTVSPS
jgi:hypothetical protein